MLTPFEIDSELKTVAERGGKDCIGYTRVVIDDPRLLHAAFWKHQPDKTAIRRAIENGTEVNGAHLEYAYMIFERRESGDGATA